MMAPIPTGRHHHQTVTENIWFFRYVVLACDWDNWSRGPTHIMGRAIDNYAI